MVERFAPAQVVEFFASTEANAVLVNLTGEKIGSVGSPLPGGAELEVAAWDLENGRILERTSGFARRCKPGEIGLLLAEFDRDRGEVDRRPLRGVFEPEDAWLSTGDLVKRDRDGDYWLVDTVADVIHGPSGAVPTIPVEDLLATELPFVDLAAVYGVRHPAPVAETAEFPVAAITVRPGEKVDPVALRQLVERELPEPHRPLVIRVLDLLPLTAGHRIRKRSLRSEGLGLDSGAGETLWLAPDEAAYVPLTDGDETLLLARKEAASE